jgi:hypothetical protein
MKITVEVPLFGEVTSSKMIGSKWSVACERRDYEIPEFQSMDATQVLSYRLNARAAPVEFHLVDRQSVRDTGQVISADEIIYRLEVGRNTNAVHPFFERAFKAMATKLGELSKRGKASLRMDAMPASFVDALSDGNAPLHTPAPLERGRSWWDEKLIEPQRVAFDAWMARFLIVGDRLMNKTFWSTWCRRSSRRANTPTCLWSTWPKGCASASSAGSRLSATIPSRASRRWRPPLPRSMS